MISYILKDETKIIKYRPDNYYCYIINVTDKELQGAKNNALINICAVNYISDPYVKITSRALGDIFIDDKNIYLNMLKNGGKSTIKLDKPEQKIIHLNECIDKLNIFIETHTINKIYFDYDNLFVDNHNESIITQMISSLQRLNTKVFIYLNSEDKKFIYKTIGLYNEPSLELNKYKISPLVYVFDDLFI